jgi:hypothetical protein
MEEQIKEFTAEFWDNIGKNIALSCNENNKELETAWLKGGKQVIRVSITIGDARPPEVKIKLNSTTGKISTETTIDPAPVLPGI